MSHCGFATGALRTILTYSLTYLANIALLYKCYRNALNGHESSDAYPHVVMSSQVKVQSLDQWIAILPLALQ